MYALLPARLSVGRAAAAIALLLLSGTAALAQGPIRVFVTSADAGSGFSSNGTADSVADLTSALSDKRRLTLVTTSGEADVVVSVEARDSHFESSGVYSYKDSRGRSQYYSGVRKERVASGKVAGQVDKWVAQNTKRLMERRSETSR